MRIFRIAIAALALLSASPAVAGTADPNAIREEATKYEIAFQALNIADAAITMDCLHRNVCREGNPIYGRNPSDAKLIGVKLLTGIGHWLIFQELREHKPRTARVFAQVSAVVQGGIVAANLRFTF